MITTTNRDDYTDYFHNQLPLFVSLQTKTERFADEITNNRKGTSQTKIICM